MKSLTEQDQEVSQEFAKAFREKNVVLELGQHPQNFPIRSKIGIVPVVVLRTYTSFDKLVYDVTFQAAIVDTPIATLNDLVERYTEFCLECYKKNLGWMFEQPNPNTFRSPEHMYCKFTLVIKRNK